MKYRKKPVVIEAVQWNGKNHEDIRRFYEDEKTERWLASDHVDGRPVCFYIKTREGKMNLRPWDYLIKGIQNEFYPCKPDIFEATYEKVEESTP